MRTRGYKETLTNLIELKVRHYAQDKANGNYCSTDSIKLEIDKSIGFPTFEVVLHFGWHDYNIHGYLSEWCDVVVTSIRFDRVYMIQTENENEYSKENKHYFLTADELKDFHFDI